MAGLARMAATVAMYSTRLTWARPPQMQRLPRKVPLSRLKRRQTSESGNLFAGQCSQLRQMSKQSDRQHRSNPRHRPEQLVALAPDRGRADQIRQFIIEARQPLFQPTDVLIDASADNLRSVGAAIPLGSEHRNQLVAPHYECGQRWRKSRVRTVQRPSPNPQRREEELRRFVVCSWLSGWLLAVGKWGFHMRFVCRTPAPARRRPEAGAPRLRGKNHGRSSNHVGGFTGELSTKPLQQPGS